MKSRREPHDARANDETVAEGSLVSHGTRATSRTPPRLPLSKSRAITA